MAAEYQDGNPGLSPTGKVLKWLEERKAQEPIPFERPLDPNM